MDAKEVLTQAKAKIATMATWCQGTLARRTYDVVTDGFSGYVEVDPHDPRACQWCLDGAIHAVLRGMAYTEKDQESVELYRAVTGQLADCSVKLFETTEYVGVNDGDSGVPDVTSHEEAKRIAFENTHKVLDCAIASA